MEWQVALVMMLGIVCGGMFLGLPVVIAFFAANIIGTFVFLGGDPGLASMPMEFPARHRQILADADRAVPADG